MSQDYPSGTLGMHERTRGWHAGETGNERLHSGEMTECGPAWTGWVFDHIAHFDQAFLAVTLEQAIQSFRQPQQRCPTMRASTHQPNGGSRTAYRLGQRLASRPSTNACRGWPQGSCQASNWQPSALDTGTWAKALRRDIT